MQETNSFFQNEKKIREFAVASHEFFYILGILKISKTSHFEFMNNVLNITPAIKVRDV